MKERSSSRKQQKPTMKRKARKEGVTIGMDLGDKTSRYCVLSKDGEILHEGEVPTTKAGMAEASGCFRAGPDRRGSWNPFALGESFAARVGP